MTRSDASRQPPERRRRMGSPAVLGKYWAIQLPLTVLVFLVLLLVEDRFGWPGWLAWMTGAVLLAKDAILYPFVWRAYDSGDPAARPYPMEGARGMALNRIDPSGLVRVGGELWRAELSNGAQGIEQGETVQVSARRGLTLLVEREEIRSGPAC